MYGGYEGGWLPSTYITGGPEGVPIKNVYKRSNGREYMDIRDWAVGKWGEPDERDKQLKNIFLSARIMKY